MQDQATTRTLGVRPARVGDTNAREGRGRVGPATLSAPLPEPWFAEGAPVELRPGDRFGRYRLETRLAGGGMGAVFRAHDSLLQRAVALKVILPEYSKSDPAAGLRFLREAEIVAGLAHPHVVQLLDAGLEADVPYMTFEFIHGRTLAQRLRSEGPLKITAALELLLPVCSAVAFAHTRGIVHGDLKPTNIAVGEDYAGRLMPKVLDFGVSFFASIDPGLDPTRSKIAGTPGYIAPEWLAQGALDERLDCFSLGCVLYELLAGKGPFSHCRRLSEAALAAQSRDFAPLRSVDPSLAPLEPLIERALQPEPDERFSTLSSFAESLLPFASRATATRWSAEFSGAHHAA